MTIPFDTIEVDPDDTGPLPSSSYNLTFESTYSSDIEWFIVSVNTSALVYFNFYWIFDLYTGFGLSVNYGSFSMDLDADGDVRGDDPILPDPVGSITAVSRNRYRPYYFVPTYTLGAEINLFLVRFTLESMVSLRNGSDINLQFGTRFQF